MIDPSLVEAWQLALKPFTEELGEGWRIVRAICVIFLVITMVFWISAALAPTDRFQRASQILNVGGWVTFLMFIFTYLACCFEVYIKNKDKEAEKIKKTTEFR